MSNKYCLFNNKDNAKFICAHKKISIIEVNGMKNL